MFFYFFLLQSQIYGFIYKQYTEFYHEFNHGDELNKKLAKLVRESNKLGDDIEVMYKIFLGFLLGYVKRGI